MKKDLFKAGAIFLATVLICTGCNQRPKVQENKGINAKGEIGTVEVGAFDAVKLKDQIVETIKSSPKPKDITSFIGEAGLSYMSNLTLPVASAEKYLTAVEQSLASGVYKFDALYAKTFDRNDIVLQLGQVIKNLNEKLGLNSELEIFKTYGERVKSNSENTDSLNVIIPEIMNELAQSYAAGEHSGVYGLGYVGANIQGLYILTQSALMAKDNEKMIEFIGKQHDRVKSNYMLLELMAADEAVNPIFEKMTPILSYFTADQKFTAKQLAEVAPLIEQLRNQIIK